jgi:hypothetical protein
MLVLLFIIGSVLSGGTLPAVLATLTALQWVQLAAFGINTPRDIAKIERFIRAMDKRYPCNASCHRLIAARQQEVRGGQIGWGRSPMQF